MSGYYNNKTATLATFCGGFMRTGDLGYHDENGRIFIVDRLKELIKYKAFQVTTNQLFLLVLFYLKWWNC